ncbi:hypothetical protein B4090_2917 [Bacillus licheniformis]|nr:hypothetical protein B4090_2917 [Bacillus licheniformis]
MLRGNVSASFLKVAQGMPFIALSSPAFTAPGVASMRLCAITSFRQRNIIIESNLHVMIL